MYKLIAYLTALLLAACTFTNQELSQIRSTEPPMAIQWKVHIGQKTDHQFWPAHIDSSLIIAAANQKITALDSDSGKILWKVPFKAPLSSGVGAGNGTIIVTSLSGQVLAYDTSGKPLWQTHVGNEVTALPIVSAEMVLVYTVDGKLYGLSRKNGELQWQSQYGALSMMTLRRYTAIAANKHLAYIGLAGGRLAAIHIKTGQVVWESTVAVSHGTSDLERMVDVVSAPVIADGMVCAAAYQSKVSCFHAQDGKLAWSNTISSHLRPALGNGHLVVVDDHNRILAYHPSTGQPLWSQAQLSARQLGQPLIFKDKVVLGDDKGKVHFFKTDNGDYLGSIATGAGRLATAPLVLKDHLIIQTQNGYVIALGKK